MCSRHPSRLPAGRRAVRCRSNEHERQPEGELWRELRAEEQVGAEAANQDGYRGSELPNGAGAACQARREGLEYARPRGEASSTRGCGLVASSAWSLG